MHTIISITHSLDPVLHKYILDEMLEEKHDEKPVPLGTKKAEKGDYEPYYELTI